MSQTHGLMDVWNSQHLNFKNNASAIKASTVPPAARSYFSYSQVSQPVANPQPIAKRVSRLVEIARGPPPASF